MIFFRKLHKWLGLVLGLQMLIWLVSGMLISFIDHQSVSGSKTRQALTEHSTLEQFLPLFPIAKLPVSIETVRKVTFNSLLARPVYRVELDDTVTVFDAQTGDQLVVDQTMAETIAQNSYRGEGRLTSSTRLENGSDEMRRASGALWQVNFDDSLATRVYVSASDGRMLAHRNSRWKLFDFLLMLHFMDYMGVDSFNNPQIIVFGFGTLWLAISGLLLVFYSFSRSDFRWLPGMKFNATQVKVAALSEGQPEQEIKLDSSQSLYASLSQSGINLPSNCDGSGSCGLCKVRYKRGLPDSTAVDREWISASKLAIGERLACQHKPCAGDAVVIPGIAYQQTLQSGEIVSTRWLTPLLKEIRLRPDASVQFCPGDYLQFQVPACSVSIDQLDIPSEFFPVWEALSLPEQWLCTGDQFRAYSVAVAPGQEESLVFTVRFSPPPPGTDLSPGAGSSYLCSLRPGDRVSFRGPAGSFRLVDSEREKILIGGGAGVAPLKSMVQHLLNNQGWQGKLRFWYGARNQHEILYKDTFKSLVQEFGNFEWGVALSDAEGDQSWSGDRGFIHDVVLNNVLKEHDNLQECEFYLCGPPLMLTATREMLRQLGVAEDAVQFDDFGS
jgi:Na+-transporting NADH:ubiquinone oxidoreductase subunit F